jgi:hypothetical protein
MKKFRKERSVHLHSVMAGFIPAIHFPETRQYLCRFWKMDGRHEGGHDDFILK